MKRLGRVLGSLLAVALAVISLQAVAETQVGGRDFNHLTTGFPLSGVHGTVACETCHIGGVFKGTPRACDGCHALGKRIVATPKSTSHIVTDALCDTCHFNTSTFLGARFNHGSAIPGQCQSCHNGRNAAGRPASHFGANAGQKMTASCDVCHRSLAFLPAGFNHVGVIPGSCESAGCHDASNIYNRNSVITRLGKSHTAFTSINGQKCDVCHTVFGWLPAKHMPLAGTCSSCHNGTSAEGKPTTHVATTSECDQCHTNTISWLGALGGMPSNHIPFNTGVACTNCHTGAAGALVAIPTLHINSTSYTCAQCHITPNAYTGNNQKTKSSHQGSSGNNCSNCHKGAASYSNWNA